MFGLRNYQEITLTYSSVACEGKPIDILAFRTSHDAHRFTRVQVTRIAKDGMKHFVLHGFHALKVSPIWPLKKSFFFIFSSAVSISANDGEYSIFHVWFFHAVESFHAHLFSKNAYLLPILSNPTADSQQHRHLCSSVKTSKCSQPADFILLDAKLNGIGHAYTVDSVVQHVK